MVYLTIVEAYSSNDKPAAWYCADIEWKPATLPIFETEEDRCWELMKLNVLWIT